LPLALLAVAGCELNPFLGENVFLTYTPNQVCQKFSIATQNQQGFYLQTWPDGAGIGPVGPELPPLEVAAPQQPSTYSFLVGGYARSIVPMDIALRCLPDKPAVRVQFGVPVSTPFRTQLRVTENASKPEGLEVLVEQLTSTP